MKYAGIDVSKKELVVAFELGDEQVRELSFPNTSKGHHTLIKVLTKRRGVTRVCLEPTGIYHLDLALELAASERIELIVPNPRAVKNFAKASMARGKSDSIDAKILLDFAKRMKCALWTPPTKAALGLRAITRQTMKIVKERTKEKNRLHAAEHTSTTPAAVITDLKYGIEMLTNRIDKLTQAALEFINASHELKERMELLLSVKGIGQTSAIRLLGELMILPQNMDVRQFVAHSGLDPIPNKSGSSLNRPMRISKAGNAFLRQCLYLPAVTAARSDPHIKAYYQHLRTTRGLNALQAQVAVMRKLLHAIHGMFKTKTYFNGTLFFRGALTSN